MIGQTVAHYNIIEKLGEGGMGVVYKAEDTSLNRFVALKFLPEQVSASAEDTSRFIQEAQAAAALNHPNICTIYGIEQAEGKNFIVMEFVEGQTLQKKKSSLSMKQAIDIGIQIAEGLAAAHEKGIVHRDIKPENIMIRKDYIVQIMDFGLAKLRGASRLTKEGTTVGTVGYMSPEQVQGQDLDHRTDIFSLGVVLYELLAGESPFKGVHEMAINYETVNVDPPPVSSLKTGIEPDLDAIVLECLRKDKRERYQSAAEVAKNLRRIRKQSDKQKVAAYIAASGVSTSRSGLDNLSSEMKERSWKERRLSRYLPWFVAAGFFCTASWLAVAYLFEHGEQRVTKSYILPPPNTSYATIGGRQFALSPDGRLLAFVASDSSGRRLLYVRPLSSFQARPLEGTKGAWYPFWSPDSRSIGFFAADNLKRIEVAGGPPQVLCKAVEGRGGTWNKEGTILFVPDWIGPMWRVSASGGTPEQVTNLDARRQEANQRYPSFLPDGRHFLYCSRAGREKGTESEAICVASLDSTEKPKIILQEGGSAAYTDGYLLFVRDQTLMAQAFNAHRLEMSGDAHPIAEQVGYDQTFNVSLFSVSENGILAFQAQTPASQTGLLWLDRSGKRVGLLDSSKVFFAPQLSPDGKKIAASIFQPHTNNDDIWTYDIVRKVWTRLTFDPAQDDSPLWSADGNWIFFSSTRRNGQYAIYETALSGKVHDQFLIAPDQGAIATSCSPDGKFLAYHTEGDPKTQADLWILPLTSTNAQSKAKPIPFLQTRFNEAWGSFSPDGKWMAYESDETGSYEVYVRPFPGPGPEVRISSNGGLRPQWRKDGKELYYVKEDNTLMAVGVRVSGTEFKTGLVRPLFKIKMGFVGAFSATADGQRFLVVQAMASYVTSPPIRLVEHWNSEIEKK